MRPPDAEGTGERAFVGVAASLAAGGLLWWIQTRLRYARFPASDFIQPQAVAGIASQLPGSTEDSFILSAWSYVGAIPYEPIGSDLTFRNGTVRCARCHLPQSVMRRNRANCVGASSLLASLLATRLAPDRVAIAFGDLRLDGVGGHAWVLARRADGQWYVLEATAHPGPSPWNREEDLEHVYVAQAIVTPHSVDCSSEKLCVAVRACPWVVVQFEVDGG